MVFSSVTPPFVAAIFVVSAPLVRFTLSDISQSSTATAPTSVQIDAFSQVVIFGENSNLNRVGTEPFKPSFETPKRKRISDAKSKLVIGVSSTPPVAEVASTSLPSSFLHW